MNFYKGMHHYQLKCLALFVFWGFAICVYGQETDTLSIDIQEQVVDDYVDSDKAKETPEEETELGRTAIPWYFKDQIESPFPGEKQLIDTALTGFQLYDYLYQNNIFYAQQGNVGHASPSLVFDPGLIKEFSPLLQNYHHGYLLSNEDHIYIRPKHVFSEMNYVVGGEREQLFCVRHAQKIDESVYMSFGYRVISSPGLYSRMATRNNNLYGIVDYTGLNDKYHLIASGTYSKILNNESGGLRNRVGFEQDPVRDSVFLYRAEFKNYYMGANLSHYYRLGFDREREGTNTVNEDSVDVKNEKRHFNLGRIGHEFEYKRKSFVFDENGPVYPFFNSQPFNEQFTYDSTVVRLLQNEISWSNFPQQTQEFVFPVNFKIYLKHQHWNYKFPLLANLKNTEDEEKIYPFDERIYNQYIAGIDIHGDNRRYLSLFGNASIVRGGYNNNDYSVLAGLNIGQFEDEHRAKFFAKYNEKEAPYFMNFYSGNYHGWSNKFKKMQIANVSANYLYKGIKLQGNYFIMNNMIFVNENVEPEQNSATINAVTVSLETSNLFWNRIGLLNKIVYQAVPDDQLLNYPALVSYNSLFYNGVLFDRSLYFQIGLDLLYNSPYYPSAYMPVVMQFYKQTDYKSDNLFLLDMFLNLKISDVRVFIKYQNFLGLLIDQKPNYQIPFYPLPETMFKFGVSWMFFN